MSIVQRVKDILLNPKGTWPVIDAESATVQSVYVPYVLVLAAIPALAAFIGYTLIGVGGMGFSFRVPIVSGLVGMVVSYVLSLAMVFVLALIVDALAPTFGGTKNQISALKVVAYGATAGFLGGIFSLLPALSILGLLAALYSIYLIYTGLPVLMKSPPDKAVAYTAVVILCGIVAGIVIGVVSAFVTPGPMGMRGHTGGMDGAVTIKTPQGEVKIDTGKMEEMAKKMEQAGKQMEAAQKSGDPAAAGQAAAAVLGAITGGQARGVVPASDLKAMLPETLGALKRESFEAQSGGAMGITGSSARAVYRGSGDQQIELSIADTGGLAGLMALAGWANMTTDRETDREVEKIYKQGSRTVREEFKKDGSHSEYMVILPNGLLVQADGRRVPLDEVKKAVEGVGLAKLEAIQPPNK
jgi:hypothetical protein